ncbi:hypothetical protein BDW72DRAFT_173696 [Aspergillus terricola var. indicus]
MGIRKSASLKPGLQSALKGCLVGGRGLRSPAATQRWLWSACGVDRIRINGEALGACYGTINWKMDLSDTLRPKRTF